jgi:hypothetical protein
MTRLQAIQERASRLDAEPMKFARIADVYEAAGADVPWLLARVEQMRSVIASEVALCFGCHGSGCDSCKALCDALSALDEEVRETVQS